MDSAELNQFKRLIISAVSLVTPSFVVANYKTNKKKIIIILRSVKTIGVASTTSSERVHRLAYSEITLPFPRAEMLKEKMKVTE